MNDYLPIEIRHLDSISTPLSSTNVFPVVVGSDSDGYETQKATIGNILDYVNLQSQDPNIRSLSVRSSAYVQNNLSIGNVAPDVNTKLYVDGNVVISGSLSSLGTSTVFQTENVSTSSLSLNAASGVTLSVKQEFEYPIAQFLDGDVIVMHIDGASERPGYVGINTTNPNTHLTVYGNISAREVVFCDRLNAFTVSTANISSNNLTIDSEILLGVHKPAKTSIGNISGGNVILNGNVYINTTSLSSTSTVLGSDLSDVYINGDLFVKNLSANGNVYFNTLSAQRKEFILGNESAINNILGTNLLSGFNYINGEVYVNTVGVGNTHINSKENTGNLEIGNNTNQLNIKSGSFSIGTSITGEVVKLDFTNYDELTSAIEDVYSTSNIVFSSLTVGLNLTSVSSFRYRESYPINGLYVNLNDQVIKMGDTYTEISVNANNFGLSAAKSLYLNSNPGGIINIGSKEVGTILNGYDLNINNENDGVTKNTRINNIENSGNVYIGNIENDTQIFGNVQINALTAFQGKTVIGSLCSYVDVYNLNVLGGDLKVTNLEADNLITNNPQRMLGGFNSSQSSSISGFLRISDALILESGIVQGNVIATGKVSGTNLNIDGWDVVYAEYQVMSAAWGTGGVAQQLFFDSTTNILSQTFGNSVSLEPLLYNAVALSNASFIAVSGADITTSNFTLTGDVNILGGLNQGVSVLASGNYSHAEGHKTTAGGNYSHTEGYYSRTGDAISFDYYYYNDKKFTFSSANSGIFSYLVPGYKIRVYEGDNVGDIFTTEVISRDSDTGDIIVSKDLIGRNSNNGYIIDNSGSYSHAEGYNTVASGPNSHAEGYNTIASGENSHAQGKNSVASGRDSHVAGVFAEAGLDRTWVWQGSPGTTPFYATKSDQFAIKAASGIYIASNVGINTDDDSNALTVNGNISSGEDLYVAKNTYVGGDILIYGNLSALGQFSTIETQIGVTSALEITNIGSGPALKVTQTGLSNIAEFYDDNTPILVLADNLKVGIGTKIPSTTLHLSGTDALVIPVGSTLERVDVKGAIRYNSDANNFEGYDGSNWGSLGGVKDIDQNTYISAEDYPGANNNQLKFVTNGTEKAIIQPDGLFGIGTSIPNEVLTVSGNISCNGNIFVQSLTAFEDTTFNKNLNIANDLTVFGNISSGKNLFAQSVTAFEDSKFDKNLHVNNDLTVSNVFNLSAVTFTGEIYTSVTSITAQNEFIKVIANGQTKYIRLYDIE